MAIGCLRKRSGRRLREVDQPGHGSRILRTLLFNHRERMCPSHFFWQESGRTVASHLWWRLNLLISLQGRDSGDFDDMGIR